MTSPQSPMPSSRPFAAAPDANRYFPSAAIEEARLRITRSVQRGEGPVLLIGAAGLGKTLLLEVAARQFGEQLKPVTLIGGQLCTRRALLQMILFQLELPYRNLDEGEMRLSLIAHLRPSESEPRRILLLVDEADALPQRLLEELRALTNLSANGQIQVNLVLAGSSNLEEQFADPKLHLFSQRVSGRCYLSAFGRAETFRYIQAQVTAAGHDPQSLFTDESLEAIFAATDGVPRLINQLGDQLMWMVEQTGYAPLDGAIVQQAWSEIQQLPAPWNTQTNEQRADDCPGNSVEFGELPGDEHEQVEVVFDDDVYELGEFEDDDLPASIPISTGPMNTGQISDEKPTITDTLELTEQLLSELDSISSPNELASASPAVSEAAAHNPFAEAFESEEMVLDQYSTFESLLLAEAPRVVNYSDTSFSAQLQQLESADSPLAQIATAKLPDSTDCCTVVDTFEPEAHPVAAEADEISEVLVIEDSAPAETAVVSGQKFRQLFSSLENSVDRPCYG